MDDLSADLTLALVGGGVMTTALMGEWRSKRPAEYRDHKASAISAVTGRLHNKPIADILVTHKAPTSMHGFEMNPTVLRRWEQLNPGTAMPSSWKEFAASNQTRALELRSLDPELVSLLDGTASAGLRADAISQKISAVPPDPKERAQAAVNKRVSEILAQKPWGGEGKQPNISLQLELASIAPQVAEQQAKANTKPGSSAEEQHQRDLLVGAMESKARQDSLNHAMPHAAHSYNIARQRRGY